MADPLPFGCLRIQLRQGLQPARQRGLIDLEPGWLLGSGAEIHSWSQQVRLAAARSLQGADPAHQRGGLDRAQLHPIGRKEHSIEGLMHGLAVARQHQQVSAGLIKPHQCQGPHSARGADQAGGQAGAARSQLDRLAALAVQEAAGVAALQPDQADRAAPAGWVGGGAHERAAAATAAISSSRNRLCSSRPAAVIASRPPSCRSTIVTTRSTT